MSKQKIKEKQYDAFDADNLDLLGEIYNGVICADSNESNPSPFKQLLTYRDTITESDFFSKIVEIATLEAQDKVDLKLTIGAIKSDEKAAAQFDDDFSHAVKWKTETAAALLMLQNNKDSIQSASPNYDAVRDQLADLNMKSPDSPLYQDLAQNYVDMTLVKVKQEVEQLALTAKNPPYAVPYEPEILVQTGLRVAREQTFTL